MRSNFAVTTLSIAAMVLVAGPAYAQTSGDKPTMKEKVEQKTEQAKGGMSARHSPALGSHGVSAGVRAASAQHGA